MNEIKPLLEKAKILVVDDEPENLKQANEALKISIESFNNIVNKSLDGVLVLDQKGIVRFINPSAEILFNRSSDEIMGELFGLPFVADEMMEVDILRSSGEKGIAEMRVIDTEWEGESALLALLRDVTERKRAEEAVKRTTRELKLTVEELKRSNQKILEQQKSVIEKERLKLLLQMAGATVHELSQPLMSLLGNIDLIKLYKDRPEKLDKHVNAIEKAGQRISDIIKKIQNIQSDDTKQYLGETCIINLDQKLKTLIVEDVDKDYEKIKNYLKDQNQISLFRTSAIKNSIELLKKETFNLILLDHILPDGTSVDFLKSINEKGVEIPVVVITGQGNEMIASQVIKMGAYDYLPKAVLSEKSLSRCINNVLEKFNLKREIKLASEKLAMIATIDELTGVYNRRYFTEAMTSEVARAKRYETKLTICLVDLDDFKLINDNYGHPAGDMVLKEISNIFKKCVRESDFVCRYGGDEFAIILPDTEKKEAETMCKRMGELVSNYSFNYESQKFKITISTGIAQCDEQLDSPLKLLAEADSALYHAKKEGKNSLG